MCSEPIRIRRRVAGYLQAMRAMVLHAAGARLVLEDVPDPIPGPGEVRIAVRANGICRTDLHVVDGELPRPRLPLIPGHQVVGVVDQLGAGVEHLAVGQRVGVPWLGWTCGECPFCARGRENLCDRAEFTGYDRNGGFAELCVADARYALPIPEGYPDNQAAPLLCAGLIGTRSLRMAGEARRLGLYGFGAAAHIVAQVAVWEGREVYAFTRAGDARSQQFARSLGVTWAGAAEERPPAPLEAAILFAPVGEHVPLALAAVEKGGTVVCAGIHMSDIPAFPYALLWGERVVRSVANLTRADGEAFLALAPRVGVRTHVVSYPLERANEALDDLRRGAFDGAAVLTMDPSGPE
jgi:alcohol dehydrogenase, propanol-preferring